jgi:hypothetical protein
MDIIGASIQSKLTNKRGIITGIDKKYLEVQFMYGGSIKVPNVKREDLLLMSDELKQEINVFLESLKPKRKTVA